MQWVYCECKKLQDQAGRFVESALSPADFAPNALAFEVNASPADRRSTGLPGSLYPLLETVGEQRVGQAGGEGVGNDDRGIRISALLAISAINCQV